LNNSNKNKDLRKFTNINYSGIKSKNNRKDDVITTQKREIGKKTFHPNLIN
tara:strand:+ start:1807 stop:1959 length:153 start_codon:yes stop_codon:yes gene_type:complete